MIVVLLIKKGIQLENSEKSYNIAVTSYPLQHINKDSYYDIQGNQILIKVKDEFKTLSIKKCNIKGSKDLPKLMHHLLLNNYKKIRDTN